MKYTPEQVKLIIQEKVVGQIEPAHDEKGHHYRFVGTDTTVDSVTTKLILDKPHLVTWAVEKGIEWLEKDGRWDALKTDRRKEIMTGAKLAHRDIRDDAGFVGHYGHDAIETYSREWIETGIQPADIKTFIKSDDPRVYAVARSGEAVFKKYEAIPVATEILVGVPKYNSAGTLDMLVLNSAGELELWDWKSSNQVNDTYALQVAAYKKFFEIMTGLKIKKVKIMHLSKDYDKFTVYDIPKCASAFKAFNCISGVYDYMRDGKPKLIKDVKRITL